MAHWTIRPRIVSTGGLAQVTVIGGEIKYYQILLNPEKMMNFDVALNEVNDVVQNMNQNASGGVLYEYGNEYIIRGVQSTNKIEELGKAVVKTVNNIPILIEDIAEVKVGNKAPKMGLASTLNEPAVLMTITKQPNTSTLELTEKLDVALAELQKTLPKGVNMTTDIYRQERFINSSIDNVQKALYEGAIFVVIVLFLFLMNIRTTVISLVTIPLEIGRASCRERVYALV